MNDPTHLFEGSVSPGTERAAKLVSLIGQPPFLAIIPFAAVCMSLSQDIQHGIVCTLVCIFAAAILPISIIMYFSRRYSNSDRLDVERKEDRMIPLVAGVLAYGLGVLILYLIQAPWLATVLMICYTMVTAAILAITPYWKISIHSCGVVGPSMGLAVAFWPWGLLYIVLLPAVAWSRYVLRKHTPLQLAMGAILGFVFTFIIFTVLL